MQQLEKKLCCNWDSLVYSKQLPRFCEIFRSLWFNVTALCDIGILQKELLDVGPSNKLLCAVMSQILPDLIYAICDAIWILCNSECTNSHYTNLYQCPQRVIQFNIDLCITVSYGLATCWCHIFKWLWNMILEIILTKMLNSFHHQ